MTKRHEECLTGAYVYCGVCSIKWIFIKESCSYLSDSNLLIREGVYEETEECMKGQISSEVAEEPEG